jgi:hypothetical protein
MQLAIDFFCIFFGSTNIDPPHRSRRMQGLPPEEPEVSQPLHPNPLKDSPQQSEIQDHVPSQPENTDSLERFRIVSDPLEAFRLPLGYKRRILRLNSSGELVIGTFGLSIEIVTSLNEDPYWTTDIAQTPTSRRNPSTSETGVEIPTTSEPLKTSYTFMIPLDHFNTTTCYYFSSSEKLLAGPNLTTPLQ